MNYPRLLIISPSNFNSLSGGGITFTNLFRGWPRERIAVITNDPIPPTKDICEKFYFLSSRELPWSFPFSLPRRFGLQEKLENTLKTAKGSPRKETREVKKSIASTIIRKILPSFQRIIGDEIPTNARLSQELKEWISQFSPELIYTILGNLPYLNLVRTISGELKLPYVIHMMDDWPQVMYRRGILGPVRREKMQRDLKNIIENAAGCLGICQSMCDAYETRYGRKFSPFANALESEKWRQKGRMEWKAGKPFKIFYGGALMENSQLKSVFDVAEVIPQLRSENLDMEFHIHAPFYAANRYRRELEENAGVKVFDIPETMDIESIFSNADLLLLPVNFDEESVNYIRYSMPTKIPAYMFSGTPTLAYGPDEVASIEYAKQWAYCVTERNKEKLFEAIKKLVTDEKLRETLGKESQNLAEKRHDRAKVSKEFHDTLRKTVSY